MIYVVIETDNPDGPVKIGYTTGPAKAQTALDRLNGLQCANHRQLAVVAMLDGAEADERALHLDFSASHVRGEWFRQDDAVRAFIELHRCDPVASTSGQGPPAGRWTATSVKRPPMMHLIDRGLTAYCNAQVNARSVVTANPTDLSAAERPCRECARFYHAESGAA